MAARGREEERMKKRDSQPRYILWKDQYGHFQAIVPVIEIGFLFYQGEDKYIRYSKIKSLFEKDVIVLCMPMQKCISIMSTIVHIVPI